MAEVGNVNKKCSAAALSLGYLVAVLMLPQYSLRSLFLNNALASRSTFISISSSLCHIRSVYYLFSYQME